MFSELSVLLFRPGLCASEAIWIKLTVVRRFFERFNVLDSVCGQNAVMIHKTSLPPSLKHQMSYQIISLQVTMMLERSTGPEPSIILLLFKLQKHKDNVCIIFPSLSLRTVRIQMLRYSSLFKEQHRIIYQDFSLLEVSFILIHNAVLNLFPLLFNL